MKKFAVALVIGQACAFAIAQAGAGASSRAGPDANFVCGGVSQEEAQEMKAQARQHPLMLTFAESSGAYLAGVDVEIRSSRGALVLSAKCEGPIMLVDLPPGSWRITAQVNGQSRQKTIATSSGRHVQATFTWPAGTS